MANILLSFLGTNNYLPCTYFLREQEVKDVRFVQEALSRILCHGWKAEDRIIVFTTNDAADKNWRDGGLKDDDGNPLEGLATRLSGLGLQCKIGNVLIPEGYTAEDIWQIFNQVCSQINDSDTVFFDITHAFRSIPMLAMVVLQYLKVLKNIQVAGIYYGAFEVLGPAWEVKEMPLEQRRAPIIDLTDFVTLLEWTSGVHEFIHHGNPAGIAELLEREAGPRIRESQGKDETARLWKDIGGCLYQISGQIMTNRGKEIVDGKSFVNLKHRLEECSGIVELPAAFWPLLRRIEEKIAPFKKNDIANCLETVRWCLDHNLVQQGLTMLQEGLVTVLVEQFGLDWQSLMDRELVTGSIHVINQRKTEAQWNEQLTERIEIVRKIVADPIVAAIAPVFDRLSKVRNDINHGGFLEARSANRIRTALESYFEAVIQVLENDVTGVAIKKRR